ncbi:MAG: dagK [Labilithrix sp.]|jgi:diacylglycerol kinase (ATP)|nr:dagK [Labilithrix sp.]
MSSPVKVRIIANPVSGGDHASEVLVGLNERLRPALHDVDIVLTIAEGDATRAAAQAARDGYDHVYVAGGDGTLNEVINGVASIPGALSRVTFGLLPLGTGNDFAHALGVPEDLAGAIDVLAAGRVAEVDLGRLDDRCFVNVSAGGFVAEVSDAVDPKLKSLAGKLAYVIGGAGALLDHEPVELEIAIDDGAPRAVRTSLFAICNSRLVGGGRLIAPYALIDDGILDVCIVHAMKTLELVGLLTEVARAVHIEDPRVEYFRARSVALRAARPFKVNTDGEVLETTSCRYDVLPRAARFFAGDMPFAGDAQRG